MNGSPDSRRHDLDALRASAMLLGIAFHVALSFAPGSGWAAQDRSQSAGADWFAAFAHGFRMPLFMLVSGFFTAMLFSKRGINALLWHRFRRVLLPCLLGLVTIVPVTHWSSYFATVRRQKALQAAPASASIWVAIRKGDLEALRTHLQHGVSPDVLQPQYGITPLTWAALTGQRECVSVLLEKGAAVGRRNRDGSTALHAAAFLGHAGTVQLLIAKGADVNATNYTGEVPLRSAALDWGVVQYIAGLLAIPVEKAQVEQGRARVVRLLQEVGAKDAAPASGSPSDNTAGSAQRPLARLINGLMEAPVLAHLWFLWILWWLVVVFAGVVAMARRLGWRIGGWFTPSYVNLLWLIPLTMLPVWFMDNALGGLGPDTSAGIIPRPRVFGYYAIFFFVGAFYYECDDTTGRLGRGWRWMLPVTLLVVFPVGLELSTGTFGLRNAWLPAPYHRAASVGAQALYAWLMIFGCMGMFRSLLVRENGTIRYLADSCYWLYLAHLPLVIVAQTLISEWPLPWLVKLSLLFVVLTGFLLLTYEKFIRYTWVGTMLNGPRKRPANGGLLPAVSRGSPGFGGSTVSE